MRHVDEGTIHAWLDEQIADPADTAWIEQHLRECATCRARVAEERATRDHADALLAAAAPAGDHPSFEALVSQAGVTVPGAQPASAARATEQHRWLLHAGWAASLALAAGLGWSARELTLRDDTAGSFTPATVAEDVTGAVPEPTDSLPAAQAPAPAEPPSRPADVSAVTANPRVSPRTAETGRTQPPAAEADALPPSIADADAGRSELPASPAPGVEVQSVAPTIDTLFGTTRRARLTATQPPVQAFPAADSVAPIVTTSEWRLVPRTTAAARTGMPIYGIDGLAPVRTELNVDGTTVRTTYRLEFGDVELLQQLSTAEAGVNDRQATARALPSAARGGFAGNLSPAVPRTWSGILGNARVTLRTTSPVADLDALGARLRVD